MIVRTLQVIFFGIVMSPAVSAETLEDIQNAIEDRRAAAIAAYNAGDVEAMVSHYTEDTWHISPRRPPVMGRTALSAYFAPAMKSYLMAIDNEILNINVEGDVVTAITKSTLNGMPRPGVEVPAFTEQRLNLSVFKRQANGDWLIHRFIDTTPTA